MKAVRVRDLKDNPTKALRAARAEPVLVLNRDDPEAMILSLRNLGPESKNVRLSLARALYDADVMSLGQAARLSGLPLERFVEDLGAHGIPVFRQTVTELRRDIEALRQWQKRKRVSSSTRQADLPRPTRAAR